MWNLGDPLGYSCPIITVNGQVQQCQTEKDLISKASAHLRMKALVTPQGKPLTSAEETAESEVNSERIVEEGEDEYQL